MVDDSGYHRVGEAAAAAELTVRTLHYYDEVGLVRPSHRTTAGHRAYTDADLRRLTSVGRLRQLGLDLADIARCLDDEPQILRQALARRRDELERRMRDMAGQQAELDDLLERDEDDGDVLIEALTATQAPSGIDRPIVALVYADLEAACDFLERVFQLGPSRVDRDADGRVVHAEVRCGIADVWMHQESAEHRLASPVSLGGGSATMVVLVDDVDAHYQHAIAHRAEIGHPPDDMPYGYREYSAYDREGALWAFLRPLPAPTSATTG